LSHFRSAGYSGQPVPAMRTVPAHRHRYALVMPTDAHIIGWAEWTRIALIIPVRSRKYQCPLWKRLVTGATSL
jgi:hypothetical protein